MRAAFLAVEAITAAENVTSATAKSTVSSTAKPAAGAKKSLPVTDAKNKRQINQFVRTPGANVGAGDDGQPESIDRIQAQSYPLQLTHAIYSQQPIYARRTTAKPEPQVVDEEQELERQQNEVSCMRMEHHAHGWKWGGGAGMREIGLVLYGPKPNQTIQTSNPIQLDSNKKPSTQWQRRLVATEITARAHTQL